MNLALDQAIAILKELENRDQKLNSLVDHRFAAQAKFIQDASRFKAALCTRRAGKSNGVGRYLLQTALRYEKCNVVYIALTRDSAWRIMWKDVLHELMNEHEIDYAKTNETKLTIQFRNQSVLYLLGADKDHREMEKLLGQKFKLAVIDEGASYRIDLRDLVYRILRPALSDQMGTCCIVGTPGNVARGLFYDITTGQEPGWSLHKWSTVDNPYMKHQWEQEITELIAANPRVVETPMFKQMYKAEWFIDTNKLVYKFDPQRNVAEFDKRIDDYYIVMGVDLGYEDSTAFSIMAWNKYDRKIYVLYTYKQSKMTLTDVANKIKGLTLSFNVKSVVIDASAKQAVEEMRQRHGLILKAAEKADKLNHIAVMNDEFILGNIVIDPNGCDALIEEYTNLIWEDDTCRKEHPGCDNHLADATYYAFRECKSFRPQARPKKKEAIDEVDDFWKREEFNITKRSLFDDGF